MGSFIFCHSNLMLSSFCIFEDMRGKNELIDFRLAFDNRTFVGHRIVLAAAIPYFREIFATRKGEIALDGVDPDALQAVIDFAYKGKIEISNENVQSLIEAAKFFCLGEVYDSCCKFLEERLAADNVWDIRIFAKSKRFSELVSVADQYVKENFETFSKSERFQDVSFSYLKKIISMDDLKVITEESVFEAVIRWVKFSPTKRRDCLQDLLSSVRMSDLDFDYLKRVSCDELIQAIEPCKKLVEQAKLEKMIPEKISESSITTAQIFEVQNCQKKDEFGLYAVCDSGSGISVKSLNMDSQVWVPVSTIDDKLIHKVAVFGARIYIFLENTIRFLHVKTLTWRLLGTFHESLMISAVVCHKKKMYFFGGPSEGSDIVRCFNPRKNDWCAEDKMIKCLDFPGAASMENFIYVTGGSLGGRVYKTVGSYDPDEKNWGEVAPMLSPRYSHGCTSLNGKVYVCGGSNDVEYLSTMEVYDPKTNHWKIVSSMKAPRTTFSIVPHDGKIYALGGVTEESAEMEVYDPSNNKWKSGVPMSDDTKCEIYLVEAKVPAETDKKGSVLSLTSTSSHQSKNKKENFVPVCKFCGTRGHISPDCWHKLCYNCGKPGHVAGNCNRNNKDPAKCSQCGKTGKCIHDRPVRRSEAKCYACAGIGHFSRECPSSGSRNRRCYYCGVSGHIQGECKKTGKN